MTGRFEADRAEPSTTGLAPTTAAGLAYLAGPFSAVLVLLAERSSRYVRFHAWQSIAALGALGVAVVLLFVVTFVSIAVSATVFWVLLCTSWALWIGWIALWAWCLVRAVTGSWSKLPVVGAYAERRAGLTRTS
jgi:uncharacterized membrane protein